MENKEIIVNLLQNNLIGKLDVSSNFNPQFLADAIIQMVNFNKPIEEFQSDKRTSAINRIKEQISILDSSMNSELSALTPEEKLLANFVRGKLAAYAEVFDILNNQL